MQNFLTTQFLVVIPLLIVIVFQMWNALTIVQVAEKHQIRGIAWRAVLSGLVLFGCAIFIIVNIN